MLRELGISDELIAISEKIEKKLEKRFKFLEEIAEYNQYKVLKAMQDCRVSDVHFTTSSGYGYNDDGRDLLEQVYAKIFSTQDALVRPQIVSGTHALNIAMSSNLRPNDELLSITGKPYDTLEKVIGISECSGSLKDYGVIYKQVDLKDNGDFDFAEISKNINNKTKMVIIQRSKGYQVRKSLSSEQIGEVITYIKNINSKIIIMVDNCYGEFVQKSEPSDYGADMVVGSLIKNPGGGLAPTGGYIVGTKECIQNAAYRLTSPGLGKEVGASLGILRSFYQGIFLAPNVTLSALKGAIFAAELYEGFGFKAVPDSKEERFDIIQSIEFGREDAVIEFCKGIQKAAPVDSHVIPEPWAMPGYDSDVIMAAGAFIQGSSIELSADAPIKEPYAVYFQGGLTWSHAKFGILLSAQKLLENDIIKL